MRRAIAFALALALSAAPASAQITGGGVTQLTIYQTIYSAAAYGNLICNGVGDDTATIAAFDAAGGGFVPRPGTLPAYTNYCKTTTPRANFVGQFYGPGRIADSNGDLLGPIFAGISTRPTQLGSFSIGTEPKAFDADSKSWAAVDWRLTGTALGTASGTGAFQTTPNAYPIQTFLYSSAGNQNGNDGTGSRTGAYTWWGNIYADSAGGDTYMSHCQGFFAQHNAAATSAFANGAVGCHDGQVTAGQSGQIAEMLGDWNVIDGGNDIQAYILVSNFTRTNATGNLGATWIVRRHQVKAANTMPADAVDSIKMPLGIGMDYGPATFPDLVLAGSPTISSGGTGYSVNDVLSVAGGTCDTTTKFKVRTVDGSGVLLTIGLERAGKCSVAPATPNSVTGGTGTGASIGGLVYKAGAVLAMPTDTGIFFNAVNDTSIYGAGFPTVTRVGTTYIRYEAASTALNFIVNNATVSQMSASLALFQQPVRAATAVTIGPASTLTLVAGELGLATIAPSASAPGAAGAKLAVVCGTAGGSAKLIAYAGTSATPVTITDNIGSGVTGC